MLFLRIMYYWYGSSKIHNQLFLFSCLFFLQGAQGSPGPKGDKVSFVMCFIN